MAASAAPLSDRAGTVTAGAEATIPRERAAWLPPSYVGWLTIATAFGWSRSWFERMDDGVGVATDLARLLAALLCLGLTAPWMMRPSGCRTPAVSPWRTASSARSIIAVVLAMIAALMLLDNGGVGALVVAIGRAPAPIFFTVPLLALAEEIYFREALPVGLAAMSSAGSWRGVRVAAGSQLLYAVAHLPVLLLAPAPRLATAILATMLREILFGVLLLALAGGPSRRIERVLIHSVVNLSIIVMPQRAGMQGWHGLLMCILGGMALQLSRWRAPPPPDYTPAWQRANDEARERAGT